MPNTVSLNINAQALGSNPQRAIDVQSALQSAYTLILDDHKSGKWHVAKQLHQRSPTTGIIHRRFLPKDPHNPDAGGWEGELWRVPANDSTLQPHDFVNFLATQDSPPPYIIHQIMNEPAVYGAELVKCLNWLVAGMEAAAAANQRWCVYNAQTVAIRKEDINAGVYDVFLFALAKHRDKHVLGVHEYGLGILPANVNDNAINHMTEPGAFPFERWYHEPVIPEQAHLGRYRLLLNRAKAIGATPFAPIVMTEYGWDDVRLGVRDNVAALNAAPPMGAITLNTLWSKHYPAMTRDECAAKQVKWAKDVFPEIAAFCLYGIDSSFENGRYHVGDMTDFLTRLIADVNTAPPQTPPTPPPAPLTLEQRVAALEAWRASVTSDHK